MRSHRAFIVLLATGIIGPGARTALAQDPYFVHLADPHVAAWSTARWEELLAEILALSPAPDLVLCSGDLVAYGAGMTGIANYEALLQAPFMTTVGGDHFLDDGQHRIPIFFAPGNHDYRNSAQRSEDLANYKARIHPETYYHRPIDGGWALFSLDSGCDTLDTWPHALPEGTGLFGSDLARLESDLDMLDGVADGTDRSDFRKIIVLHHPHQYPDGTLCSLDGAFIERRSILVRICEDYGVDWVLAGHLHPYDSMVFDLYCNPWHPGSGTRCIVAISAADRGFRRESGDGTGDDVVLWSTTAVGDLPPPAFPLLRNHPNPFSRRTTIRFDLPRDAHVVLRVFDVTGRLVTELLDQQMTAGTRAVDWMGTDAAGGDVPDGIYGYRLVAGDLVQTGRLMVVRRSDQPG